jgi:hypothetical protein
MALIAYVHASVLQRLRELRSSAESDRGDNPVPTAVIIVGLALLAGVVVVWAMDTAQDFMDQSDNIDITGN